MHLYKSWWRKGKIEVNCPAFKNAEALVKEMLAASDFKLPEIASQMKETGTSKFQLKTVEGHLFEMVLLEIEKRKTLCLSSQVGCQRGCRFCSTGKMGFIRNLSVEEIVAEAHIAWHIGAPFRNVVFMGMGEPFDNFEAVCKAASILSDPNGLGIGARRITISTSGVIDKIYEAKKLPYNLAISLNAATDEKRTYLMPIGRQVKLCELKKALLNYGREIFISYVLINGVNSEREDATQLVSFLRGLPCKVNLIPYNGIESESFYAPTDEMIRTFANVLKNEKIPVFIRAKRGDKIMAACGQLNPLTNDASSTRVRH